MTPQNPHSLNLDDSFHGSIETVLKLLQMVNMIEELPSTLIAQQRGPTWVQMHPPFHIVPTYGINC